MYGGIDICSNEGIDSILCFMYADKVQDRLNREGFERYFT